jgi:hypothetical protein
MRIARNQGKLASNPKPVSDLGIKEALALLADPDDVTNADEEQEVPLPAHKIMGRLPDGRILELMSAANPTFVFCAVINLEQTDEYPNGYIDFGKRPVRRDWIETWATDICGYSFNQVEWGEQEPCEPPSGYYPGYVPEWMQPGWPDNQARESECPIVDERLDNAAVSDRSETGPAQ